MIFPDRPLLSMVLITMRLMRLEQKPIPFDRSWCFIYKTASQNIFVNILIILAVSCNIGSVGSLS